VTRFALIVAMLTARGVVAFADPAPDPTSTSTPQSLYAEGQAAYDRGDFSTAIVKWRASYDLSHASGLLFNLAQAYRLRGDCANALLAYEQFITIDPASEQRPLADDLARELEVQCGASKTPLPPTPAPVLDPPTVTTPERTLKIAGLTTAGAGAASLAIGLGLGHHAQVIGGEVTRACSISCDWDTEADKDTTGRHDATIGYVLDAVGVAAIVGGAVMYYLGDHEDGIHVAPTDRSRGAVLSWSRSW
jgi:tetratricopeptide (TPR) repeat protein